MDIQIGTSHACAILDNGGLTCWGNDGVALGRGNDVSLATPLATPIDVGAGRTAKAVSVGMAFTCAVLDNDRIKCWGRGNNTITDVGNGGQLGNGSTAYVGNDPGEMGDTLAYAKLGNDPGTSAPWKVKKLIASNAFACATLANDRLKCWGQADNSGILGSGNGLAYGAEIVNDDIPFLDLGKDAKTDLALTVKDFALGHFHGCALLSNDSIRCWGADNGFGALGRGDRLTIGDEPGEMGDAMIPVALKPGRKATALYASFGSTCARVDTSTLSCWGRNGQGLLGIGLPNAAPSNAIGDEAAELGAGTVETILE